MLINLLENGLKITEVGTVIFRVSKIKANENTSTICFQVEDTGIGMKS
ncbi:MAG: hypothetical protein F6K10_02245 [Moorea sp. SIO2B7]|nr:hypothetical protein [Moorena sp. SIO2B7]